MKKLSFLHMFLVAALYVSGTLCALAQDWNQILKLSKADRTTQSVAGRGSYYFGQSLAIDRNYAVVAAPWDMYDASGKNALTRAGSVFVFEEVGGVWTQVKKIVPEDRGLEDGFGASVAIFETTIVVGCPNEDEDANNTNTLNAAGSVYIFSKDQGGENNWGQVKKLVAPVRAVSDLFGSVVDFYGDYIMVGSYLEDEDGTGTNTMPGAGAVYVFGKNKGGDKNWGLIKKLTPSDRSEFDGFGYSISLNLGFLAVGAYQDDRDASGLNSLENAGSVYIFQQDQGGKDNWGQVKKIVAQDRAAGDKFGQSVSCRSFRLAVGAPYEDEDGSGLNTLAQAGSAYVFELAPGANDKWNFIKKLVAGDRGADDNFGFAVSLSISGSLLAIGAYAEDEDIGGANTLTGSGSAYVFNKDLGGAKNWGQLKKLVAPDRAATDQFGLSVAVFNNEIFIGAPMQDLDHEGKNFMTSAGGVYFFEKNDGGNDNWGNKQKMVLKDLVPDQFFGYAVALDGDFAVVGMRNDFSDAAGLNHLLEAGSAWVIKNENGTWTPIKKLVASDRNSLDHFGVSVAISGETVVVGAYTEAEDANGSNTLANAGSAYIFSKNQGGAGNWGQVKKITAPVRAVADLFGYSVAVSGYTVVVGAYQEDEDAAEANAILNAGAAYVYYKDQGGAGNWGVVKKMVATDRQKDDQFGFAVDIDFNTLVIGSALSDYGGTNSGAAYIFSKDQGGSNNWGQLKKIGANDRAAYDLFGTSVAISGHTIAIGAYGEDEDASGGTTLSGSGSAYIFLKDQNGLDAWGQTAKLVAADRAANDMFGIAIAISDTIIVVGAGQEDEDASGGNTLSQAGSAYIFTQNHGGINLWGQVQKIVPGDRGTLDRFGYMNEVAISGQTILVGACQEDDDANGKNGVSNTGSVYFFKGGCSQYTMSGSSGTVVSNQGSSGQVYYNNNCTVIAGVAPSGQNPITGSTVARVWVNTEQPSNYVTRVYEITPALNPETATGRVTLYYSQAEFDAFNAVNTLKLPAGPSDATGKANLLIEKRTGQSSDGSGNPYSYSGVIETINPADNDIVWNAGQNRWEVSFDVTGFSGFFVKTTESILPIRWISFSGVLNKKGQATLSWKVEEKQINGYTIEKSTDSRHFLPIGVYPSAGDGLHIYHFTEESTLKGHAYYRIMQREKLGSVVYSPVVLLKNSAPGSVRVYPNPFTSRLIINLGEGQGNVNLNLCDVQGKTLMQVRLSSPTNTLDLSRLSGGVYFLRFETGEVIKVLKDPGL